MRLAEWLGRMGNSITLALYLATRARADKSSGKPKTKPQTPKETIQQERAGYASQPRPDGPLIWFHTGDDRHGLGVRELAQRMQLDEDGLNFLLTTNADRRKPSEGAVISQCAPAESIPAIRRFLDHWRPDIAVWSEPDLRPALIAETDRCQISLVLIDANTARPDPQAWRWRRGMAGSLLSRFAAILPGDDANADALRRLGADPKKIQVSGFLEEGTPPLPCNEEERDAMAAAFAVRPVWLAAHVTSDEITGVVDALSRASRRSHRLLLVVVPDDPEDGADWADRLSEGGFNVALRSRDEAPNAEVQIYIADTTDEMGLWYRLAPISFLGRSMGEGGGVNPYEAAALGSAIVHGPNVRNFRQAYARLTAANASRLVRNDAELGEAIETLLSPDKAATIAHEAWNICSSGAEVTDKVKDLIFTSLEDRGLL